MWLADEPLRWMESGQWWILSALCFWGAVIAALGVIPRRVDPTARRCSKCKFDMRMTPSQRCGECGHEARSEKALKARRFMPVLGVLGFAVALAYPSYRAVLWSRDRGWTPPLSRWKIESHTLANGIVAELIAKRNPYEWDGTICRIVAGDVSVTVHEGLFLDLGASLDDGRVIGLGDDIDGDGTPDLVVEEDFHACGTSHEAWYIFSLTGDGHVRKTQTIDRWGGGKFADLDGDGVYEFLACDSSFVQSCGCFIDCPPVVLRLRNGRYDIDTDAMQRPAPTEAALHTLAVVARQAFRGDEFQARDHVWNLMNQLIYAGHASLAVQLFEDAWPRDDPDRDDYLERFRRWLRSSEYWDAIRAMNDPFPSELIAHDKRE